MASTFRGTSTAPATSARRFDLGGALRRAFAVNALLTIVGLTMIVVLAGTLVGIVVDHRVITGAPAWLKPAKFAISISIYSFTLLYLLTFIQGHRRLVAIAAIITAIGLLVEMALIGLQAARGTTSHFNFSTPLNSVIFDIMGGLIVHVWLVGFLVGVLLLLQKMDDAAFAWSLRLGMLLALVGMALAFLMLRTTPAQLTAANAGHGLPISGAHSVGVADGGPGLPIVGWSTVGGDLRIPHFFGLHGLQVMLALGWLLLPGMRWLSARHRVALVWTAALTYLGGVLLLAWQALRGQSIVHPDGLTVAAFGTLFALAVLATAAILIHSHRHAMVVAQWRRE